MEELMYTKALDCDDCGYYRYFRCLGSDCTHHLAPEIDSEERGEDEPLAENRESNVPKWCPLKKVYDKVV